MIEIVEKHNCYGCTACASVCPKNAICMKADADGFKYPKVCEGICVSCGLCLKVCPVLNRPAECKSTVKNAYALKHNDKSVLENSTSGGVFTALSDVFLSRNGIVYGAAFDSDMSVQHIRATASDERNKMRGSKYVASNIDGIFSLVKADLASGKIVLFTGTPCQIDGLKRYLGYDPPELLCVDLVCHGTPSPKVFKEHLRFLEKHYRSAVMSYSFRPKRWTWQEHREIVKFKNGKEKYATPYTDLWRTIYYSRLANRPSCHNCKYSNLCRPGDITIADCRGIDKIHPQINSDEGVSLVFVNTEKGGFAIKEILNCVYAIEISLEDVMQPPLIGPSIPNSKRGLFLKTFNILGYEKAVAACFGKWYFLKGFIKKLIGRK